ncbi:MAG TPA: hypothetical protein VKA61_12105, partial [Sphingomicrobium sp.]|nr:hypothetical protein [Sphingomicrobium sp.]
ATAATLVLYLCGAFSALRMMKEGRLRGGSLLVVTILGTVYAIWTFYGAGLEATAWGAVLLATGVPVYFLMRSRGSSPAEEASPAAPPGSSA